MRHCRESIKHIIYTNIILNISTNKSDTNYKVRIT